MCYGRPEKAVSCLPARPRVARGNLTRESPTPATHHAAAARPQTRTPRRRDDFSVGAAASTSSGCTEAYIQLA